MVFYFFLSCEHFLNVSSIYVLNDILKNSTTLFGCTIYLIPELYAIKECGIIHLVNTTVNMASTVSLLNYKRSIQRVVFLYWGAGIGAPSESGFK